MSGPQEPGPGLLRRRDVLRAGALGAAALVLQACGFGRTDRPSGAPAASVAPSLGPLASTAPSPSQASAAATATGSAPPGVAASTAFAELVGRPTDRSFAVCVVPERDGEAVVEVGTTPGAYTARSAPMAVRAGAPTQLEVAGLAPGTRHWWRVRDAATAGPAHSLVTQRPPGSPFVFTLDADPHNGDTNATPALYEVALANARNDRPDFHLTLGDTFMTEKLAVTTEAAAIRTFTDMRRHVTVLGAEAPYFIVQGNHDPELGWLLDGTTRNLAAWGVAARRAWFPTPVPGSFYRGATVAEPVGGVRDGYYAFAWGDALIVVLDPYWYTRAKPGPAAGAVWGWTLGEAQYRWLVQTLEASAARQKMVFTHQLVGGKDKDARGGIEAAPLYEWGGHEPDGTYTFDARRPGWGRPIHRVLVETGVRAVFHGHDHVYVHQQLDGIHYQACPQPSMTRYDAGQQAAEYGYAAGVVRGSSGHLRISVSPASVMVDYVRAYLSADERADRRNGSVDVSYTI